MLYGDNRFGHQKIWTSENQIQEYPRARSEKPHSAILAIMRFVAVVITAISLVSAAPVASRYHIQLYRDPLYQGVIEDRTGTLSDACKNLASNNVASSMHWTAGTLAETITLYDGFSCTGKVLGKFKGTWNLPKFPSVIDDKSPDGPAKLPSGGEGILRDSGVDVNSSGLRSPLTVKGLGLLTSKIPVLSENTPRPPHPD
ncbi:hypothetical protein L218DRAFT_950604 [Marasmius fiardii PR-910]|nr:hypothetical protein L218DRAFT_950604 [Marasmius fiardii PR-910]